MRFLRFGSWTVEQGLSRVPINPIVDIGELLRAAQPLVDWLRGAALDLPFPLIDSRELWLLDSERRPLALLASACPDQDLRAIRDKRWCAASLRDRALGQPRAAGEPPLADRLEARMVRRAGSGLAQWFMRSAPGQGPGEPVSGIGPGVAVQPLGQEQFPELPVAAHLFEEADRPGLALWARHLAPWLLCLPYLSNALRQSLEQDALADAGAVSRLWRLYPALCDPGLTIRARVQERLRQGLQNAHSQTPGF